ncbi:MAG: tRNA (adenosine(37)-N6)-dimethylallyltransferase MiaA [Sphingopyxis sp.]|nr:tRNA (adenosine(37)-N6)-dimethylallyltransferase MiaA [Sphingopyxis sp.]
MTIEPPLPAPKTVPRAALIAGPTASGKSALAVALALALKDAGQDAIIINADASQVYADLAILSARPTNEEMAGIPHRLFGHIDGADDYSAARWAAEARAEIIAAHAGDALPIIVGGTGLYIRTLLHGIAPVPAIDETIRAAIRALPVREAYRRLRSADPHAAATLKPLDAARIARALEVVTSTGTPLHVWQEQREGGMGDALALSPAILLPPREWLRERCDIRLAAMFSGGAAEEVAALLTRNLDPDMPVMRAIGVRQLAATLALQHDRAPAQAGALAGGHNSSGQGSCLRRSTAEEALALAQAATRQYAKRQYTWFRHQLPEEWPRYEESLNHKIIDDLAIKLRQSLLTA